MDITAEPGDDLQEHVWIGRREPFGQRRHQEVSGGRRNRQCDRAGRPGDSGSDIVARLIELTEDGLAALQQGSARVGQANAMAVADEQRAPEFFLQRADLPADGGLRNSEKLGAAAIAAEFGDRLEIAQTARVHRHP